MVTEDRKADGLALSQSVLDNALGVVRAVFPRRRRSARREMPGLLAPSMAVSARAMDQEIQFLSGGNQQKVVLGPLARHPTRGSCSSTSRPAASTSAPSTAIHELMRTLAADGVGVLMVSSELPELIGMSDRILVMRDGRLAGELPAGATEEQVLALATGVDTERRGGAA